MTMKRVKNEEVSRIKHCEAISAVWVCIKWVGKNQLGTLTRYTRTVDEKGQRKRQEEKKMDEFFT
jgi:hypothetical protein